MTLKFLQRCWAIALLGACATHAPYSFSQADHEAPTANVDPKVVDQQWQDAVRKFDAQRAQELQHVDDVIERGPFRPDWQSLQKYEVPEWFRDAKFGIFIHWGLYSVPAFGSEWYPRDMYQRGSDEYKHHLATYGTQSKFGYKDFIPMLKAEKFDPAAWAALFRDSGARYVVPVFEHHDGFAMYDSDLSDWTAAKMGPHRDLMGDLVKALRADDLHVGASFHRVEHNFFFDGGREITSDVSDPRYAGLYGPAHTWMKAKHDTPLGNDFTYVSDQWTNDWLARSAEIVDKYKPELMWFDWWVGQPSVRPALTRFTAFYYNESTSWGGVPGVINYKYFAMQEHSAVLDLERGQLDDIRPLAWQTDTSVSNKSWGYIEHDTFKTPEFIVDELVDIVSKNGNLLLNVGPRADGTIPGEVQQILREVGKWLQANGEAIYGTRPWRTFGEGPTKVTGGAFHDEETTAYTPADFRFTTKKNVLYAIGMHRPKNGTAVIHSLASGAGTGNVRTVQLLGAKADVKFAQSADGLHLELPSMGGDHMPYAVRVEFEK
jgi:alpha-L-fucosidase